MTLDTTEVAFVTGAGSGIGAAVATRLAARGAATVLFDVSRDGLDRTSTAILAAGGDAMPIGGDVSDDDSVAAAVGAALDRYGALDTVVTCAGIEGDIVPVADMTVQNWRRVLDVNLTGTFLTARHTIPSLVERGGGSFVAVSSDGGVKGTEGFGAYCASKHGVVGLVRCLALEYARRGVRSNAVLPGFIETPMSDRFLSGLEPAEIDRFLAAVPAGRFGKPEEVAAAIAFLASDESAYTNGHLYVMDGGTSAGDLG
ncbi:SDR family NAD(P)-dependent oxidoreductase [Capillimicrobium parvum]|uniref:Levodione reductase n=1 Tax=Capillimicrobium parvum TaxID=2884022 RepID=A0A9E6XUJ2_9ACTN|nr:SDR family NAD(P)-dependent oxidoreductase [Capillimicrobium parvum]UGS34373.1 Levodione reductase [Capillimicrobium parvum]